MKKPSEAVALQQVGSVDASAERRILQLELELKQVQSQYAELQRQYAELYEKSSAAVEKMKRLELRAAEFLRVQDQPDSEEVAVQVMEALKLMAERQKSVQDTFTEFEKFLDAWTDILRPSKVLRLELTGRLAGLKKTIEASLEPVMQLQASGTGGAGDSRRCSVLAVDRAKALVFLNCGLAAGVRPGFCWHLSAADGRILARLRTVDCRREFSVAILFQGNLDEIGAGAVLQAE